MFQKMDPLCYTFLSGRFACATHGGVCKYSWPLLTHTFWSRSLIFFYEKSRFSGVFSSFYGQHSVTTAWASPSPWSINQNVSNCDNILLYLQRYKDIKRYRDIVDRNCQLGVLSVLRVYITCLNVETLRPCSCSCNFYISVLNDTLIKFSLDVLSWLTSTAVLLLLLTLLKWPWSSSCWLQADIGF